MQRLVKNLVEADFEDDLAALRRARTVGNPADRRRAEERITQHFLAVADAMARRYRNRGIEVDDLTQVARIGLIKAIRRWDPERGHLMAYLVPTINGEIKRHFRDSATMIRVPRSLYESQPRVVAAQRDLRQELSREPTTVEVAEAAGIPEERVAEVIRASRGCTPLSTDELRDWVGGIACEDAQDEMSMATVRARLRPAVMTLDQREQRIVGLRFVLGQSQQQIADDLGVSQMQVSRLLRSILAKLRQQLDERPRSA